MSPTHIVYFTLMINNRNGIFAKISKIKKNAKEKY